MDVSAGISEVFTRALVIKFRSELSKTGTVQSSRLHNGFVFCSDRCQIHLKPVLEAWNLTELVGVTWFNAVHDGFAKMVNILWLSLL